MQLENNKGILEENQNTALLRDSNGTNSGQLEFCFPVDG